MTNRKNYERWVSESVFSFHILLFVLCLSGSGEVLSSSSSSVGTNKIVVKVGVVLDLNSTLGIMSRSYMNMALSDFYAETLKNNTTAKLQLVFRSAGDVVGVAHAAMDLIEDKVVAIIGPQTSEQARFVIELGRKYETPIVSFTATSPNLSPIQNPYFIRTTSNDSVQVQAINDIIQAYGWREIVPIFEDTDFGRGLILYLANALQQNGSQFVYRSVINPSSNDTEISNELNKLMGLRKRIFLLHMTASLGSKFLVMAKKKNMMTEGYGWIVTDGLSSLLDPITDPVTLDSMEGVVGVKPYFPTSTKRLVDFQTRLKKNLKNKPVWALALAVQEEEVINNSKSFQFQLPNNPRKRLKDAILKTRFPGLAGDFHLVNGELERSTFEIFNVVAHKERNIGYWSSKTGLSKELDEDGHFKVEDSKSLILKNRLKRPIWPGDTPTIPKINLTIGYPVREGFPEFIRFEGENAKPTGFCIDVFTSVVDALEFGIDVKFVAFINTTGQSNGTYDELLEQISHQKVDAVVGDVTIVANRSNFVDFTLPFSESGVSMLVKMQNDRAKNMWIFLKPLSWDLWLVSFVSFIFTGFVVWLLECRFNTDFGGGPPQEQVGIVFWFTFSTLVFAHRERILNNLSRFLLIIWVFVVLILTQSYTANLSAMLTAQRLKPSFVDANEIKAKGYCVGYLKDSFVRELLVTQLGFDATKLRAYKNAEDFRDALSKGPTCNNDGVAAIIDEIPYIKVFLSKYGSAGGAGYQMVGPTYKTGGFAFAFPKGSSLVASFSRAILNITEDKDKMNPIEQKYFPKQADQSVAAADIGGSEEQVLDAYSFAGLFIITAIATLSSFLIYVTQFFHSHWSELSITQSQSSFISTLHEMAKLFYGKHFHSSFLSIRSSSSNEQAANPAVHEDEVIVTPIHTNNATN